MSKPKLSAVHAVVIIIAICIIIGTVLYFAVSHSELGTPAEFSGRLKGMNAGDCNWLLDPCDYEIMIGETTLQNVTNINENKERYLVSLIDKDITLVLWEYETYYKYIGAYIND